MSKHSHWAKIKHDKGGADAKRGKVFSKIVRAVQLAARDGADPAANFRLRLVMDQAKTAGVTKNTIERAVLRGSGQDGEGIAMSEEIYEGFTPGGAAIIIHAVTDNKNRTFQDLKHLFNKFGGNLGGSGSVAWQFTKRGILRLPVFDTIVSIAKTPREDAEMYLIEAGAEDIVEEDGGLTIYTKPEELKAVEERVRAIGVVPEYAAIDWVAKDAVEIPEEKQTDFEAFEGALDELEDVNEYYTNSL
ncbi:MAG: YebC/PmpR family DNA-binding transcriptional regulator [Patescibacteria group bacterium]